MLDEIRDKRHKKEIDTTISNNIIESMNRGNIIRHGDAAREHLIAYTGVDNERSIKLNRSLNGIAKSQVDPNNKAANLKQQAGYAAEVKSTARRNAENRLKGDPTRQVRTDDIGRTNDQIVDILEVLNGEVVPGSEAQMKFVGKNANELLKALESKSCQKYIDADVKLSIPDDYYEELVGTNGLINSKIEQLEKEITRLKNDPSKAEILEKANKKLEKLKHINKKITKSGVTSKEAMEARTNPLLSTLKDMGKIAHKGGVEAAKTAAVTMGVVSTVKGGFKLLKGEQELEETLQEVGKDISVASIKGYIAGFSGTTIQALMGNSSNETLRNLSKTNLPGKSALIGIQIAENVKKLVSGDITSVEFCDSCLLMSMTEMANSAIGLIMHNPQGFLGVATSFAASTVAVYAASHLYNELKEALDNKKIARQRRIYIEQQCEQAVEMIIEYRINLEKLLNNYFNIHNTEIAKSIKSMDDAIVLNDSDGFIASNIRLQQLFGYHSEKIQFTNMEEFDSLMLSDEPIKI